MREKNLIILCVIFAVLIGLIFLKKSIRTRVPTTEETADIIEPTISTDSIEEILIRLGDGSGGAEDKPKNVHLAKEDGHWIVKTQYGVYANDTAVTPLLDKLDQLKGEQRSDKEALLGDYGITDEEAVHVELRRREAEAVHVVIGTQKTGFQNSFVRLNGTNAVYAVNDNLLSDLGVRGEGEGRKLDAGKWTDKRVARIDVDNVVAVLVTETNGGTEEKVIDIRRESVDGKKQWQSAVPYAFGLSATKIKTAIGVFNNMYAREVIAPDAEGVFDAPGWTGVFTMEDGGQVKIVRGAKDADESNYYMKREGEGYFYLVPVSTFENREKQQGNIFASNPLNAEEDNIDEIEIRDVDSKKKFYARRKIISETAEAPAQEKTDDQEAKKGDIWETPDGKAVDTTKVRDIITKIKSLTLEIVARPAASLKDGMVIRITKAAESEEYTISRDIKLDNGKECHFLRARGDDRGYCISKPLINALQNALP